jgi:arginine utilization regulatory protein
MNLVDQEDKISFSHLPNHVRYKSQFRPDNEDIEEGVQTQTSKHLDQYLHDAEIFYLKRTLDEHNGNITKTARTLGMSRQNLQYRLRKYGLK